MNIRQCRGNSVTRNPAVSPTSCPFRKSLFLATGMLVPATDRRGLGAAKEHPSSCPPDHPSSPLLV